MIGSQICIAWSAAPRYGRPLSAGKKPQDCGDVPIYVTMLEEPTEEAAGLAAAFNLARIKLSAQASKVCRPVALGEFAG